jgi:hypothetical protein
MNFIERIFGASPVGGNGSLEVGILLVALLILARVSVLRRNQKGSFGMPATIWRPVLGRKS